MTPLIDKVAALQERAQPGQASTRPAGLTQREIEVLRLVAEGKPDREIAKELDLPGSFEVNPATGKPVESASAV